MGIRGFGATKAEAFEQAARALTAVVTDAAGVEPREAVSVACEAPNDELLLADWLNSLIYEMATRKMLFSRFDVSHRRQAVERTSLGRACRSAAPPPGGGSRHPR